jgi:hypothetical protein
MRRPAEPTHVRDPAFLVPSVVAVSMDLLCCVRSTRIRIHSACDMRVTPLQVTEHGDSAADG